MKTKFVRHEKLWIIYRFAYRYVKSRKLYVYSTTLIFIFLIKWITWKSFDSNIQINFLLSLFYVFFCSFLLIFLNFFSIIHWLTPYIVYHNCQLFMEKSIYFLFIKCVAVDPIYSLITYEIKFYLKCLKM